MRSCSSLTEEDCIHIDCGSPPASTSRCKQCWFEHRELFDKCFMRQKNALNMFVWHWARTQWGSLDCRQQVCGTMKTFTRLRILNISFLFVSKWEKETKSGVNASAECRACASRPDGSRAALSQKNLSLNLKKKHIGELRRCSCDMDTHTVVYLYSPPHTHTHTHTHTPSCCHTQ